MIQTGHPIPTDENRVVRHTAPTALSEAQRLTRLGIRVVPAPLGVKGSLEPGWSKLRLEFGDLPRCFDGPSNVGVLTGEPSGWLVDIDLDCPEARELASEFLPPTGMVTGRPGNPRSHWWYRAVNMPSETVREPDTRKVLLECRSTGRMTMVGPSLHPSGDIYDLLIGEPAEIDGEMLHEAFSQLAGAVVALRCPGVVYDLRAPKDNPIHSTPTDSAAWETDSEVEDRALAYLSKMDPAISGSGGHNATYAAATALVHGFCLPPTTALRILLDQFNPRCEPPWTERELRHKVEDAASKPHTHPFGWLRDKPIKKAPMIRPATPTEQASSASALGIAPLSRIRVDVDEHRVVNEAIAVLAHDADLFQRGGLLVDYGWHQVRLDEAHEETVTAPYIRVVPTANLRERLTARAEFYRLKSNGDEIPCHPPAWLVAAIEARSRYRGIRPLEAVVGAPILKPDGSVLQTPGYDAATRVLYLPESSFPPVPAVVTIDDARAAMSVLEEPLADFPFATPAHRAAFFAALFTPLARFAFEGPSPLYLLDANVAGAGKTLLARLLGSICQGRDLAVASYSSDSSEMRKCITTLVMDGKQVVLLDNIVGVLGNDALDRAITGGRWEDRLLGHNRSINLPLLITWIATGNNVQVSSDTTRRTLHIRLDILAERPEDRSQFKHPDLLQWVRANRERLYVAALTILSGYIQAGRPRNGLRRFGSFDGWSDLVREAVVWVPTASVYMSPH